MNYLGRFAYTLVFLFLGDLPPQPQTKDVHPVHSDDSIFLSTQLVDTTTIQNCGLNFRIFDFSCTASNNYTIGVTGVPGIRLGEDIVLEEICLIIEHDWTADLDISLQSPSGRWVEVSTDNGGASNDFGDPTDRSCERAAVFSMSACIPVAAGEGPFLDRFLPEGNFNDFNDGTNPNGNWVLQLCDDALGDQGTLKAVELVFTNQIFRPVTSVVSDTIESNAVELSWTSNNNSCNNTLIEYGPPGFIPGLGTVAGSGTLVSVNCPVNLPFRLAGLNEFTAYDIYIRELDNAGNVSPNSCPFQVTTECNTGAVTLSENFDSEADCGQDCGNSCPLSGLWTNATVDDFDWLINSGATSTSETGPTDDITGGGQYLYIETSRRSCRSGAVAILESNCLAIDASAGQCHVSFYYHLYGSDINQLEVAISTDNGENWISLWSIQGDQGDQWIKQYLDLGPYDGQIARLRILGYGGSGRRGDLAIDDIQFYGTTDLGASPFVFYADQDGDGFGDPAMPVASCLNDLVPGAVRDSTDCNDDNPNFFPGALEIRCNGVDENCNGMADDRMLVDPILPTFAVCQGDPLVLALPPAFGTYYWFAEANDSLPIHIGNNFTLPNADTSITYYVVDTVPPACGSQRLAVPVTVNPVPELLVNAPEPICQGTVYDLSALAIVDVLQLTGQFSFHSGSPATSANELPSSLVQPASSTTYFIKKTTTSGCAAEVAVDLNVFPEPELLLTPGKIIPLCIRERQIVTAAPLPGVPLPVTFRWSNGTRGDQVELFAGLPGQSDKHFVTITDARGCSHVDSVEIQTANSVSSVSVVGIDAVSTCGGSDGAITLNPLDGTGPFDYHWDGPQSGQANNVSGNYQIASLSQGSYRVTVVDLAPPSCAFVLPILVVNGPAVIIDPNVIIEQESCFGAQDGAIQLNVFASNPVYEWSNGDTTEDLSGVGAGVYTVTITDGSCSVSLEDLVIASPPLLEAEVFEISAASCADNLDGELDITVRGGLEPYTFSWNNLTQDEDLKDVAAGTYSVTITDANDCTVHLENLVIPNQTPLAIFPLAINSPNCSGEETGIIRVEADGGTPPYRFNWSFGRTGPILAGIPAGIYTLTLTDAAGCTMTYETPLEDALPLSLEQTDLVPPSCNGVFDGGITLAASGGTAPYEFYWEDGTEGATRDSLSSGSYSCEIIDANGCVYLTGELDLIAPVSLVMQNVFAQGASCLGVDDGFIDLEISGGTAPYSYEWSHGDSVARPEQLAAGFYTLTVTDQNGCVLISPEIEVVLFEPLALVVEVQTGPSCGDSQDGRIELRTESLSLPVRYAWNTGDTTEDLRNLGVGQYHCTVTDAGGCIFYLDTIQLIAPPVLSVEVRDIESPSCAGLPEGVAIVDVSGGVPPYTYQWNNGDTTKNLSGVSAGSYQLLVLDATGCAQSSEFVDISEPNELSLAVIDIVPTGCQNISGSIEVVPDGGIPPYHIVWTTGDSTFRIDGLSPGDYGLTLTDDQGCLLLQSSLEVFITPDEFDVEVADIQNVSCAGADDGLIVPLPLGGQGPYQFNWSNGIRDSVNQQLPGGTYTVTITDRNGCTGVESDIVIATTAPLQYQVLEIEDAQCFEEASGSIRLEVTGGTGPYEVAWNHADTGLVITELVSGRYQFTITDARGCQLISLQDWEVGQPDFALSLGQLLIDTATCAGVADGAVDVMISGGTAPYTYRWSTGDTTDFIDQLSSDSIYHCTVTDANSCVLLVKNIMVPAPQLLAVIYDNAPARMGQADGQLAAIPRGGTPPYQYRWDLGNRFSSDSSVMDLPAGTYTFTLTDASFCTLIDTVVLEESLSNSIGSGLSSIEWSLFPNPVHQLDPINFLMEGFPTQDKLTIEIVDVRGQVVYQQQENWSSGQAIPISTKLASGLYFVHIRLEESRKTIVDKLVVTK